MGMNIKKGDTVVVLSGKDKGKQGKVNAVIPGEGKAVVEGVNMVTCHTKPRRQGEEGGIVRCTPARCSWSAPSAARPPAWETSGCRRPSPARRKWWACAFAKSAAPRKFKEE